MLRFTQFLLENNNRIDVLKQKFKEPLLRHMGVRETDAKKRDEIFERNFDHIASADPTQKKVYLQWILNLVIKGNIQATDLDKVKQDLTVFEKVKGRIPVDRRDVNRYRGYQDLYDVVKEFGETKSKNDLEREELQRLKKDITTIYSGPAGHVYIPHTQEASCYLGRGTRWCTAATKSTNYFNSYNKSGKLIIFILPDGSKYQYHAKGKEVNLHNYVNAENVDDLRNTFMGIGEFMDADDRTIHLSSTHPLMNSKLFEILGENPRFGGQILAFTIRARDTKLFNKIKAFHKPLLSEMKVDAPDILKMTENGAISRFRDIAELYLFVQKYY